jgi:hypothetical protein
MIVTCNDTDCKYNAGFTCTATAIDHTADRFCTAGRRKPRDNITELMKQSEPSGYKSGGKWRRN